MHGQVDLAASRQVLNAVHRSTRPRAHAISPRNRTPTASDGAQGSGDSLAVTAVLRPAGDGACTLGANLLGELGGRGAGVHVARLRGLRDVAAGVGVRALLNQGALAPVPLGEQLGRGGTAEDARVNEAGEADAGDVARGAEDAFKVPDGLCAVQLVNREARRRRGCWERTRAGSTRRGSRHRCSCRRRR